MPNECSQSLSISTLLMSSIDHVKATALSKAHDERGSWYDVLVQSSEQTLRQRVQAGQGKVVVQL